MKNSLEILLSPLTVLLLGKDLGIPADSPQFLVNSEDRGSLIFEKYKEEVLKILEQEIRKN